MKRSIAEILADAERATEDEYLVHLWNEIVENQEEYNFPEILEANTVLRNLSQKLPSQNDE